MIVLIEIIILMVLFTVAVLIMAKNPIETLYNYPPKIQERVKSLPEYKDKIPTTQNMIFAKSLAALIIIILVSLILKYFNDCNSFLEAFITSSIIWTVINIYDVIVLDILWFCQSPKFVFKGTEDMIDEYKNYWFHIKSGIIGEMLGLIICVIIGLVVAFIL